MQILIKGDRPATEEVAAGRILRKFPHLRDVGCIDILLLQFHQCEQFAFLLLG